MVGESMVPMGQPWPFSVPSVGTGPSVGDSVSLDHGAVLVSNLLSLLLFFSEQILICLEKIFICKF